MLSSAPYNGTNGRIYRVNEMTEPLKTSAGLILYTAFIHGEIDRAHALELCAMPERSAC